MEEENDRKDSDKLEKELKTHGFAAPWLQAEELLRVCSGRLLRTQFHLQHVCAFVLPCSLRITTANYNIGVFCFERLI